MNEIDLLFTPIVRTDVDRAKRFLTWLGNSPYSYHIDDDPLDVAFVVSVPGPVKYALRDRVVECFTVLGYVQAWEVYPSKI